MKTKKGSWGPEFLLIVFAGILVIFVLSSMWSGEAKAQPAPREIKLFCESSSDCKDNLDGHYCMSIQGSSTFCGCLLDQECITIGKIKCENNKCV